MCQHGVGARGKNLWEGRFRDGKGAYETTLGAMTLQGPHQVAKQSMTIRPGVATASLKSLMLWEEVVVSFCDEGLEGGLRGKARKIERV